VGEIAGNDSSTSVAIGEARAIYMDVVVPENSEYKLMVTYKIPAGSVGKLEICDAAIVSGGMNVPCLNRDVSANLTQVA